jgi:glycosyltransferase involved in cell wall biosynthesis
MKPPVVSVLIPTYNRAYCLARTVESVLGQTLADVEVVIIDDGSSDGTEALVEERWGHEPRVVYHRQKNAGVSAARNTGLMLARGEFIGFLDSDDEYLPEKLELQVSCLRKHPELGMTWTDMAAVGPDGAIQHEAFLRTYYTAYRHFTNETLFARRERLADVTPHLSGRVGDACLRMGDLFSPMIMGNLVHTSTVVFRRELLARTVGFRLDLRCSGEDYDFHLRTCREAPVGLVDLPLIRYQVGMPDQLTRPELRLFRAQNFLKTIEPMLAAERARITLPPHMIDEVRAEAHAWIGEVLFDSGDVEAARPHLRASLGYRLAQPRMLAFFAMSMLGNELAPRLRDGVRTLRRLRD